MLVVMPLTVLQRCRRAVLITFADQVVCQGLADDTAQAFKEFCSKLVVPAFTHVGWETWRQGNWSVAQSEFP